MVKLPRLKSTIIVIFSIGILIIFLVLTINYRGSKIPYSFLGPLLSKNSVNVTSEISGIEVGIISNRDLYEVVRSVGVWEEGILTYNRNIDIVKPRILDVIITSDPQPIFRIGDTDKSSGEYVVFKSIGYEYDPKKEKLNIYLHRNFDQEMSISQDEIEASLFKDIIFYLYLITGDRRITQSTKVLFAEAINASENLYSQYGNTLKVSRK